MKKDKIIVAIGGGEIGREKILKDGAIKKYPFETLSIDRGIIKLSGKKKPKLLLIHTASKEAVSYEIAVKNYFGKKLGCEISVLSILNGNLSQKEINHKILSSDIIYVGGGDTHFMLSEWKKYGVDIALKKAYENGIILSGISAGAICWFDFFHDHGKIGKGLGMISGGAKPHWDDLSKEEKNALMTVFSNLEQNFWALDNRSAVVFKNGVPTSISSKATKQAKLIKIVKC